MIPKAVPTNEPPPRRLLERVEIKRRATVTNLFLSPVRAGITDEAAIIAAALEELREHARKRAQWGDYDAVKRDQVVIFMIKAYPDEAAEMARWALWYHSLSDDEIRSMKAAKSKEYVKQYMASQLPTDKQRKYLYALGFRGQVKTKLEASELIDRLVKIRQFDDFV